MSGPPWHDARPDDGPPNADAQDRDLLHRAALDPALADVPIVTPEHLRALALARGEDDALAAMYWRLRQSDRHGPLIRAVEAGTPPAVDTPPHLLIVPGAFHLHHPGTGADGRRIVAAAAELGWACEVLAVGSLSPLAANADALVRRLNALQGKPVLIVSLSKGSADVATALARPDASGAFAHVVGWLSLSGLVFGTPLVDWLTRQRCRMPGVRLLLWWKGLRFAELEELRHGPGGRLHEPPSLPPHLRAIHVVGFPCRRHLRHPWAGRGHARLSPLGPNDGGGFLLGDVERLPGTVFPVWGVDHYLTPAWDFSPTLMSLLRHAAKSHTTASAIPATRSTA